MSLFSPATRSVTAAGSGKTGRRTKLWLTALLAVGFLVATRATAGAETTLSQGFTTTDQTSVGSLVSLQNGRSDTVNLTTRENVNSIIGVVINDGTSLLTLSNEQGNQVQVATSGVVQTLVSNINGDIHQGDEITASPIKGVGMKATDSTKVVGIAQSDISHGNSSQETYTDKSGQKHTVLVGLTPVQVNVSYFYKQPNKTLVPAAIQNIANALAGKNVDTLPILLSIGIFLVTLVVVASIIYSMIHGSIISVGRNPMSQSAIYRNLTQMSALVVGILAVAVISIYLVLAKL
jgi:hypothetical protein